MSAGEVLIMFTSDDMVSEGGLGCLCDEKTEELVCPTFEKAIAVLWNLVLVTRL